MFWEGHPGNANLLIGATLPANREIGVPEIGRLRHNRFNGLRSARKLSDISLVGRYLRSLVSLLPVPHHSPGNIAPSLLLE